MRVILEYVIVAIFAAEGCLVAKEKKAGFVKTMAIALHFCFGGGFWIRDALLLQGIGGYWILDNILSYGVFAVVCVVVIKALDASHILELKDNQLIQLVDFVGSLVWIYDGMNKALLYTDNLFVVVACGLATAYGGGVIGKMIAGVDVKTIASYKSIYAVSCVCIGAFLVYTVQVAPVCGLLMAFAPSVWKVAHDALLRKEMVYYLGRLQLRGTRYMSTHAIKTFCELVCMVKTYYAESVVLQMILRRAVKMPVQSVRAAYIDCKKQNRAVAWRIPFHLRLPTALGAV